MLNVNGQDQRWASQCSKIIRQSFTVCQRVLSRPLGITFGWSTSAQSFYQRSFANDGAGGIGDLSSGLRKRGIC